MKLVLPENRPVPAKVSKHKSQAAAPRTNGLEEETPSFARSLAPSM